MLGRKKKEKLDFIQSVSQRTTILPINDGEQGLDFLVSFFSSIRPSSSPGRRPADENIQRVIAAIHQNPVLLGNLQHAILSQLIRADLSTALMESGIPLARGFWQEFFGRLRHKLLPPLRNENDFLYVLNRIFFHRLDYKWVEDIDRADWVAFFESIGLSLDMEQKNILSQLLYSLKALSFQVAQLGLEREVLDYMPLESKDENPFVQQSYYIHEMEEELITSSRPGSLQIVAGRTSDSLGRCKEILEYIRDNHTQRGASLHQTYILILLANRLERMSILVDLLDRNHHFDTGKFVDFFRMIIRNENRKNSIQEFMSKTMGYLAYQIAEHKGEKGGKYITSTWGEYRTMLFSAMGGGGWICLVVLIKNLLIKMPMAIFWRGFAFSINYSVGFILIEETHTTLATKQPAFTASAVAGSLDTRRNTRLPNLYRLAVTVAKVSRSQFASFLGNLVIVFPGVYFLAWLYDKAFGAPLLAGNAAMQTLMDQHPWKSLSLLYACNTGVFLFISGIIAGYVQNKIQYGRIAERLQNHPLLRVSMSNTRLKKMSLYVKKHAGGLAGNIALGFFLGMAGFVSEIFGIHFDIRHITISAGNTALALYGLGFDGVSHRELAIVVIGVMGIGFLNFLVSFSLAFAVAVRSRGVHLRDYPEFLGILGRYFISHPLDFIRPRRRQADIE
jgi:site-specific recombinase